MGRKAVKQRKDAVKAKRQISKQGLTTPATDGDPMIVSGTKPMVVTSTISEDNKEVIVDSSRTDGKKNVRFVTTTRASRSRSTSASIPGDNDANTLTEVTSESVVVPDVDRTLTSRPIRHAAVGVSTLLHRIALDHVAEHTEDELYEDEDEDEFSEDEEEVDEEEAMKRWRIWDDEKDVLISRKKLGKNEPPAKTVPTAKAAPTAKTSKAKKKAQEVELSDSETDDRDIDDSEYSLIDPIRSNRSHLPISRTFRLHPRDQRQVKGVPRHRHRIDDDDFD
jgi:hypothetical protein